MSRYITVPELAIIERITECHDMLACRNKRRYELLIDALICWRTEINCDWGFRLMPWYAGILKLCLCPDMLLHWNFSHAMIYRHTETFLMPWYTGILKSYSCHDTPAYWNLTLAMIYRHTEILLLPWYAGILKSYSCHDMPAYWNTWDFEI
jgi:hypothetical protein